jgi:hypothetical protein
LRILETLRHSRECGYAFGGTSFYETETAGGASIKPRREFESALVDSVVSLDYDAERLGIIGELFTALDPFHVKTEPGFVCQGDPHGRSKLVFSIGKVGILWKLDRVTGKYLDLAETICQSAFSTVDRKTGTLTYRSDILEQKFGEWLHVCPSTRGGHNWQPMSYHQPTAQLVIPLSPKLHGNVGARSGDESRFWRRRRQPALRFGSAGSPNPARNSTNCWTIWASACQRSCNPIRNVVQTSR